MNLPGNYKGTVRKQNKVRFLEGLHDSDDLIQTQFIHDYEIFNFFWEKSQFEKSVEHLNHMVNLIQADNKNYVTPENFILNTSIIPDLFFKLNSDIDIYGKHSILAFISVLLKKSQSIKGKIIEFIPIDYLIQLYKCTTRESQLCIIDIFILIQTKEYPFQGNQVLINFALEVAYNYKISDTEYYMNILNLIDSIIKTSSDDFVLQYCEKIAELISMILKGEWRYVYAEKCISILSKFAENKINIFEINNEMLHEIASILSDNRLQEAFKSTFRLLGATLYFSLKETTIQIFYAMPFQKIIDWFNISSEDKQNIQCILFLFSNFITDVSESNDMIIDSLLGDREMLSFQKILINGSFDEKSAALWCIWCMIKCGTINQILRIFSNPQIFEYLVDNVDINDMSMVQNLIVPSILKLDALKENFTEIGSYVETILDKIQTIIEIGYNSDFVEWISDENHIDTKVFASRFLVQ